MRVGVCVSRAPARGKIFLSPPLLLFFQKKIFQNQSPDNHQKKFCKQSYSHRRYSLQVVKIETSGGKADKGMVFFCCSNVACSGSGPCSFVVAGLRWFLWCWFGLVCWLAVWCCFVWGAVGLFVKSFFCRLRWPWLCFSCLSGPFVRLFADRLSWGFLLAFFVSGPVCLFLKSPFLWFRVRFRVRFSGFKKKGGRYFVPSSLVSGVVACGGPDKPGLRGAYRCA